MITTTTTNNPTNTPMNFPSNLANKKKPWGYIKFIHSDDTIREFYSCINILSGDRLSAFDDNSPYVDKNPIWAKSIFKEIFKKSKGVLVFEGNIIRRKIN